MKKLMLSIFALLLLAFSAKAETKSFELPKAEFATEATAKAEIFGIGKPKYNRQKITRQNMPGPVFRRGLRLQRKNGIGELSTRFENVA